MTRQVPATHGATSRREFLRSTAGMASASLLARRAKAQNARTDRPNILFFFPDQQRFDWVSATKGLDLKTPNLDAVAQRGLRFDRCYCASPLCAPSRACLAAGVEYHKCGVPSNRVNYPLDQPTFYAMLRDSGYHVAGCGKFDLNKNENFWGLDGTYKTKEWDFSSAINNEGKWDAIISGRDEPKGPYMNYLHDERLAAVHVQDFERRRQMEKVGYSATFPTPLPESAYCDNWSAANGLRLIENVPKGQPWFMQVNFPGPHPPVDITARMESLARGRGYPQPVGNDQLDEAAHVAIRQNYAAMIENIDRWLGIYVELLVSRGELENTLIVYSSDHGEMLGDHNLWGKQKPHQPSVGVPLYIAGPGVEACGATDALVSHMDLAATFLEKGGVPIPDAMDSRSLAPLFGGKTITHRSHLISALDPFQVITDGEWKLWRGYPQAEDIRIFNLNDDPQELHDLAASQPAEVTRLLTKLAELT